MTDDKFNNLVLLNLLLNIDGIGPQKILALHSKIQNFTDILSANAAQLSKVDGISTGISQKIIASKNNIHKFRIQIERELSHLKKLNAKVMTYWDDEYPDQLRKIYYPPIILYYIGELNKNDNNSIAIVGTRMPSVYGKSQAEKFAAELAKNKITIVSGLARGIDSIAHQTALRYSGRTIAIIGSGLDVIYPPENKKLFAAIAENGAVISEYPLGTKPDAQNFPRRNRIISGISMGTIIIETKPNGGAMQTANYAFDQNREVFAVPGNLNAKLSEGPNLLIQRNQAKLVTSIEDVLLELKMKIKPEIGKNIPKPQIDLNLFEQKLLSTLNEEPKHIDLIAADSSLPVSECLVNLLTLEFKGLVKQLPGKLFSLC